MPSKDKPHHEPKKPKAHPPQQQRTPEVAPPPHVIELVTRPHKPWPGTRS